LLFWCQQVSSVKGMSWERIIDSDEPKEFRVNHLTGLLLTLPLPRPGISSSFLASSLPFDSKASPTGILTTRIL
jgi:hypothetical protein